MQRAIFIDRDGVICRNRRDHVKNWDEFEFLPGVLSAMARLARSDMTIIIITNQAIINRHMVPADIVEDIHSRMVRAIEDNRGRVDHVMTCPHRSDEHCGCRKPAPGLLLQAARRWSIDLRSSYLIGDARSDMQAARLAECQRYLVLTGRGRRQLVECWRHGERGFRIAWDLAAAAGAILRREAAAERSIAREIRATPRGVPYALLARGDAASPTPVPLGGGTDERSFGSDPGL
jgi:D-glycero-D-manno-heptose 1,7-bisphosphate phosphatase